MTEKDKRRATGHTAIKTYVSNTFDELPNAPAMAENQLVETFSGDIEGEGTARVIQTIRKDGSATFVGMERVQGSVGGRAGTFLLQVSGSVLKKKMNAEWFVIPQSGTGALAGLRGDGGFTAQLGEHGAVWLDYFFE